MIQFQIPLDPVPASRPRVTRQGFSYYEQPYRGFKDELKDWLTEAWEGQPVIDYEVVVTVVCWVPPPQKTKLPSPRPDVDNYLKAVLDGMNKVVFKDDSLVKKAIVEKHWAQPGEPGRIHVYVERAE